MAESGTHAETIELLGRARDGDQAAFGGLLERFQGRVLERVRLLMGEGARRVAESGDFLQGVLLDVLRGSAPLPPDEESLLRWMTAIARNDIRDEVNRKRERSLAVLSGIVSPDGAHGSDTPSRAASRQEMLLHLVAVLERLPEDYKRVIELWDLEGRSAAEIAGEMDRSQDAVRRLRKRALVRLAGMLKST